MSKVTAKEIAKEVLAEAKKINKAEGEANVEKRPGDNSWEKATVEEKLERTRVYVKDLMRELSYLRNAVNKFNRHSHDEKGEPVVVEKLGYVGLEGEEVMARTTGGSYF